MLSPTNALSVESASAGRAIWKLIFAAHGWWSIQVHYLWKELQLGGQHQNAYSPLRARRAAWLENTHFSLCHFSRTGWGYIGSSDIYSCICVVQFLCHFFLVTDHLGNFPTFVYVYFSTCVLQWQFEGPHRYVVSSHWLHMSGLGFSLFFFTHFLSDLLTKFSTPFPHSCSF